MTKYRKKTPKFVKEIDEYIRATKIGKKDTDSSNDVSYLDGCIDAFEIAKQIYEEVSEDD